MDELKKAAVDCRPGKVYGRSKLKNVKDPKSLVLVLYRVRIKYLYIYAIYTDQLIIIRATLPSMVYAQIYLYLDAFSY